jgi:hypothetical protein
VRYHHFATAAYEPTDTQVKCVHLCEFFGLWIHSLPGEHVVVLRPNI